MRTALTRMAFRPTLLSAPRTAAFLPSIRLSSTSTTTTTATAAEPTPSTTQTPKPYIIGLTASNSYPVYKRTKAAGSSKFTVIKKIEGDTRALVSDLVKLLGLTRDEIKINPVTRHVQIKGFHLEKINEWLIATLGNPRTPKAENTTVTA